MTPLIIYITRPTSYEVFMGGKRHVNFWVQEPCYSHSSKEYEVVGETRYVDRGWYAPHTSGTLARFLFEQDKDLLEAVWRYIHWSVLPKGMAYEDGCAWADTITKPDPEFPITNYHLLADDREWESKCNICHKRFLLKVDVRTNEVQRIIPNVLLRGQTKWIQTIDCDSTLAAEYWHADPDQIPF